MPIEVKWAGPPAAVNELTGLIYDESNFAKTVVWLKAHNALFQQVPEAEVEREIWQKVKERADESIRKDAALEAGLGIFWHINGAHALGFPKDGPEFVINFFVRLGRRAALEQV